MKETLGFIITVIIAIIYILLWGAMVIAMVSPLEFLNEVDPYFYTVASMVGGVASALAAAVLGVTPPGQSPKFTYLYSATSRIEAAQLGPDSVDSKDMLTNIFLVAWVSIGIAATVAAFVPADKANNAAALAALKEFSRIWIGMAITAAMVFLGVNNSSQ